MSDFFFEYRTFSMKGGNGNGSIFFSASTKKIEVLVNLDAHLLGKEKKYSTTINFCLCSVVGNIF